MTAALHFAQGADRDAYVATMRRAGHTLQEIGDSLGVSRERARQLAKRGGVADARHAASDVDPIAFLRFARSRECGSFGECARRFGVEHKAVFTAFSAMGVYVPLQRLYRWRRHSRLRATIIGKLHAFVAEHGRAPLTRELHAVRSGGALPHIGDIQRAFGSLTAMWPDAGITPRPHGTPGHVGPRRRLTHCRRGHELTPENVWAGTRPDGVQWRQCKACKRATDKRRRAAAPCPVCGRVEAER